MTKCPRCQAEIRDTANICPACGEVIGTIKPDPAPPLPTRVTVVDFDMPMGSMVTMMVKVAIAAIPAAVILAVVGFVVAAFLTGLFSAATGTRL